MDDDSQLNTTLLSGTSLTFEDWCHVLVYGPQHIIVKSFYISMFELASSWRHIGLGAWLQQRNNHVAMDIER